jgi:hypothetical protein
LFAVVLKCVLQRHLYETPSQFLALLMEELTAKIAAKGEVLFAEMLPTIRDFTTWLKPCKVSLEGCFGNRFGIETPHAFSFKLRQDLSLADLAVMAEGPVPKSRRHREPQGCDVMCCVKAYMRSATLQQPPVTVLSQERANWVLGRSPVGVVEKHPLSDVQIESYMKLAAACESKLDMPEAANALRQLVTQREYPLPSDNWLRQEAAWRPVEPDTAHPFFPHLPESTWRLTAHFRK